MPEQHQTQPQLPNAQPNAPAGDVPKRSWFARHKILTGLGVAVVVIGVIGAINGGGSDGAGAGSAASAPPAAPAEEAQAGDPAPAQPESPAEPEAPSAGIGDTVTSGKLDVTVLSLEEVGATVGGQYLQETAQGRYVRIEARVANSGTDPKLFTINAFTILDEEGRKFNADSMATITADPEANTWVTEINPGNSVQGGVLFDLPEGAVPVTLEVSGGVFSGAEQISLQG